MRKCSKCNQEKTSDEFYRRATGNRAGEYYEKCKECYKIRGRDYYQQNREIQARLALLRKNRRKEERRRFIESLKKDKPCMDCGKNYPPWVMDYDHREGQVKIGSISKMASGNTSSFENIKIEIEKCDLVCSNCHRERTYSRLMRSLSRPVK